MTNIIFTILCAFLLVGVSLAQAQQSALCGECSSLGGNGLSIDGSNGVSRIASVIGIAASGYAESNGNALLTSGYMPVCVIPLLGFASNDTILCSGSTVTLHADAYLTDLYDWQPGNGTDADLALSDTSTRPDGSMKTITVAAVKGGYRSVEREITVSIAPIPFIHNINDEMICYRKPVPVVPVIASRSGSEHYQWWPQTGLAYANDSSQVLASPDTTTTYVLTVTNNAGCSDSKVFTVTVNVPKASVCAPLLSANPAGQTVGSFSIPFTIADIENLSPSECRPDSAIIHVRFQKTLFLPVNRPYRDDGEGWRSTSVIASLTSIANGEVFAALEGTILLGDTDRTAIIIDSVVWQGQDVITNLQAGELALTGLCQDRKLRSTDGASLSIAGYPNPVSKRIQLQVHSTDQGVWTLQMFSSIGGKVLEEQCPLLAGSQVHTVDLPATAPPGVYRIVLHNERTTAMHTFVVSR